MFGFDKAELEILFHYLSDQFVANLQVFLIFHKLTYVLRTLNLFSLILERVYCSRYGFHFLQINFFFSLNLSQFIWFIFCFINEVSHQLSFYSKTLRYFFLWKVFDKIIFNNLFLFFDCQIFPTSWSVLSARYGFILWNFS